LIVKSILIYNSK